jgi:hypothetical protein
MVTINSPQIDAIVLHEGTHDRHVDVRGSVIVHTRQGGRIVSFRVTVYDDAYRLIVETGEHEPEIAALLLSHTIVREAISIARGVLVNGMPADDTEHEQRFEVIHVEMDKTTVSGATLPDLTVSAGGHCTLRSKRDGARVTAYLYADARLDSGADVETHFFVIPPEGEQFAGDGLAAAERELLRQPVIRQALQRIARELRESASEILKPYLK